VKLREGYTGSSPIYEASRRFELHIGDEVSLFRCLLVQDISNAAGISWMRSASRKNAKAMNRSYVKSLCAYKRNYLR